MDEPFEGVDAVGARLMKDILTDQVKRGATIFLTSHVLEVVERLCDRVAIIHHGRIVTSGTLEELRAGGESLEAVDPSASPEEQMAKNQARALVLAAIGQIDLHRRAVFTLSEIDGVAMPEIALALSIPVNTAYSRLRLARPEGGLHRERV